MAVHCIKLVVHLPVKRGRWGKRLHIRRGVSKDCGNCNSDAMWINHISFAHKARNVDVISHKRDVCLSELHLTFHLSPFSK